MTTLELTPTVAPTAATDVRPVPFGGRVHALVIALAVVGLGFVARAAADWSAVERIEDSILSWFASIHRPALTTAANAFNGFTAYAPLLGLRWLVAVVLVVQRRFRSAVILVLTFAVVDVVVTRVVAGSGFPSAPVAALAATGFAATFALAPRRVEIVAASSALAVVVLARLLLGVDRPLAMVYSVVVAGTIAWAAVRALAPRHHTVELGDGLHSPRSARRRAFDAIKAFVVYGTPLPSPLFSSAHGLAISEDHALRLLADSGIAAPTTHGIAALGEHTYRVDVSRHPSEPLGHAPVDDDAIDDGLFIVRRFWDIDAAHGGIGLHTLAVARGRLELTDVTAFEVPAPRDARLLDLASMMLTLALVTYPDRVYSRALLFFTPDEIAAAFAVLGHRRLTPELDARVKADARPLIERFRDLGPTRLTARVHRWTAKRIAVTFGCWLALNIVAVPFIAALTAGLP